MPFVLVLVGMLMIITGAQGTYSQFGSQVAADFTGKGNFIYWCAAIGAVGAVGYVQALQTVSRLFMALIILSMFLSNRGFFAKLQQAINAGPATPQPGLALGAGPSGTSALTPPVTTNSATGQPQVNGGVGTNWNPFTNGSFNNTWQSIKGFFGQ